MTRLFINSSLLSIMGECNIYYINHKYILLYLGLENTTLSNQNFILNKKIYTLIFWRGNKGNKGNNADRALKIQQSKIPTFGVFNSPYSPFSFCPKSSKHCFLRIFSPSYTFTAICFHNCIWTFKFEQSTFRNYTFLYMALYIYSFELFFKKLCKPPGDHKNSDFFDFFVFFFRRIIKMIDLEELDKSWPSEIVARSEIGVFTRGLYQPHSLRCFDSRKQGIKRKLKLRHKIAYLKSDVIAWLKERLQIRKGEKKL